MRRLKYVLQSAIACFVVAGALLVLFWGAGIYNIYHESHGNISDLSELWSYISEQGLMFLIGLLAFVSFLVSGFQAKKVVDLRWCIIYFQIDLITYFHISRLVISITITPPYSTCYRRRDCHRFCRPAL